MKKEKKIIAFEIAVCAAIIFSCILSAFSSLERTCTDIRENVLRLHVIANSDSKEDQALKLEVRDAVLAESESLYDSAATCAQAEKISIGHLDDFTKAAQRVIDASGFDYEVKVQVCESFFPTKEYENVTLPAGKYKALKIIIGEGKGHNWWCVMFPPMCLSAAQGKEKLDDVLSGEAAEFVTSGKKYEVKFKIVEWYENIKTHFQNDG